MEYAKIKTKKQYKEYVTRFSKVFHAKIGTKESDEAKCLALIIKDYEDQKFVFEIPDPIQAIKYRMEQQNLSNV
jgi:HTH-type transcriptional regulator/antitoxin HigA